MAEITEIINAKLEEFRDYTENLLALIRDLGVIKSESNRIQTQIEEKIVEIGNYGKVISNLKDEGEHVIQEIKIFETSVSKEMNKALEHLHSLEQRISNLQERTNDFWGKVEEEVKGFKEGIKKESDSRIENGLITIKEYTEKTRTVLGREITEFLKKQNALISNLVQQIDSCQRAVNTFKAEFGNYSHTVKELEKEISPLKDETKSLKASEAQLRQEILGLKNSNRLVENELKELKSKFANTEFVKKIGIGWTLTKKKGD